MGKLRFWRRSQPIGSREEEKPTISMLVSVSSVRCSVSTEICLLYVVTCVGSRRQCSSAPVPAPSPSRCLQLAATRPAACPLRLHLPWQPAPHRSPLDVRHAQPRRTARRSLSRALTRRGRARAAAACFPRRHALASACICGLVLGFGAMNCWATLGRLFWKGHRRTGTRE